MSICKEELFDYEIFKICSKCKKSPLKFTFHKDKTKKDG